MRIAILNRASRPAGGVGTYLRLAVPALARRGHDLAFWHESGERPDGDPFALPPGSSSWSVEKMGVGRAFAGIADWRPDVLFSHGLQDPEVEARTLQIAPAVLIAHDYYGLCISGAKMFKSPTNCPCSRTFGWPCLVNYYPRRCGGWSPLTMVREFRRQASRLELLAHYRAIVTLSSHMRREYARHGVETTWIKGPAGAGVPSQIAGSQRIAGSGWRLLFAGRMDNAKGGGYLLDALPLVANALNRRLDVTFAGDGPARASWQASAARLAMRDRRIRVKFPGWLDRDRMSAVVSRTDLLVLPSLWPEPFGLVGLEAAGQSLPVAAFAVGGITDWLRPDVNGYLAPGDPPTPEGLGHAIIACLKDPVTYLRLRDGAERVAAEFDLEQHVHQLMRVLNEAAAFQNVNGASDD